MTAIAEPAMTIPGIPESIPRTRVLELIQSLGIDPNELTSLRFETNAIYAVVWARDPDGHRYVSDADGTIARHDIAIPILDGPE